MRVLTFEMNEELMSARDDGEGFVDVTSPIWKMVTELPLVFGAEVLTKLNEFEVKVFYDLSESLCGC